MVTGAEAILAAKAWAIGKILSQGLGSLSGKLRTPPAKRALNNIIDRALTKFCEVLEQGVDSDHLQQVQSILGRFLRNDEVVAHITDSIFGPSYRLDFELLERLFDQDGFDVCTFSVDFRSAILALRYCINQEIQKELEDPDASPLHGFFSAKILREIHGSVEELHLRFDSLESKIQEIEGQKPEPLAQIEAIDGSDSPNRLSIDPTVALLSDAISKEWESRLANVREAYRCGRKNQAFQELRKIKSSDAWDAAKSAIKGRILRTEALWVLNESGDSDTARSLLLQSQEIDPSGDATVVESVLAYHEFGSDEAIAVIGTPSDLHQFNLLAALQLMHRSPERALQLFEKFGPQFDLDPESLRIRALALIHTGNAEQARKVIDNAIEQQPDWKSLNSASGAIYFWSAFPSPAVPTKAEPWPQPFDPSLVKASAKSLKYLSESRSSFESALDAMFPEGDERIITEIWFLAANFADQSLSGQVGGQVKKLLARFPTDTRVLSWASLICPDSLTKGILESALGELDPSRGSDVSLIHQFIPVLMAAGLEKEAEQILLDAKEAFEFSGNELAWTVRYAQVLATTDRVDKAIQICKEQEDPDWYIKILLIVLELLPTDELDRLKQELFGIENRLIESGDSSLLYRYCHLRAKLGGWNFLISHAEIVLAAYPLFDTVRLFTIALWNTGKRSEAAEQLRAFLEIVGPERVFVSDIAQMLVVTDLEQGKIERAGEYTAKICQANPSTSNSLLKLQVLVFKGARAQILVLAQELSERSDITLEQRLDIARLIRVEAPQLARELVRPAIPEVASVENSRLAATVMMLCYELGMDEELGPLIQRLPEIAMQNDKSLQAVSLAELPRRMKLSAESDERANLLYREGAVSIHLLAEAVGLPLAQLLRRHAVQNRRLRQPAQNPSLYVFHGSRALPDETLKNLPLGKLVADLSALYVAKDLEILETILCALGPVSIPPSLHLALTNEKDRISPVQASRVAVARKVLEFLEDEKLVLFQVGDPASGLSHQFRIAVGDNWLADFAVAESEGGFLVDYLPLTRNDLTGREIKRIPRRVRGRLASCKGIVTSLYQAGKISDARFKKAINSLGSEGAKPVGLLPTLGDRIFFGRNTIGELIRTGLGELALDVFEIAVCPEQVEEYRGLIKEETFRHELRAWLSNVQDKLSSESTKAEPRINFLSGSISEDTELRGSPLSQPLAQILTFEIPQDKIIWCDDRWVNSHQHKDGSPIISTLDLLRALYLKREIEQDRYFEYLNRLRASNYRFVPLSMEELVFHLENAKVDDDGDLLETEELKLVRRYYNACLCSRDLQPAKPETGSTGEILFAHNFVITVNTALAEVWRGSEEGGRAAPAMANWILEALYTGVLGLNSSLNLVEQFNEDSALSWLGLDIGSLLTKAFIIFQVSRKSDTSSSYLDWLVRKWVAPQIRSNPRLSKEAARRIGQVLETEFDPLEMPDDAVQVARLMAQRFISDLPRTIGNELLKNRRLRSFSGFSVDAAVGVNGISFPVDRFWTACLRAAKGKKPRLTALGNGGQFRLQRSDVSNGSTQIQFSLIKGESRFVFSHPALELALSARSERKLALRALRLDLDLFSTEFDRLEEDTLEETDEGKLAKKFADIHGGSCQRFYHDLEQGLLSGRNLDLADFFPQDLRRLLEHYRIQVLEPLSLTATDRSELFSADLADGYPIATLLNRAACLPFSIPKSLLRAIDEMSKNNRAELFKSIHSRWASPLHKTHFLALAATYESQNPDFAELMSKGSPNLFSEEFEQDFEVFHSLLRLTDQWLNSADASRSWPQPIRLLAAWAHASRLHNIFYSLAIPPREKIVEWCQKNFSMQVSTVLFGRLAGSNSQILDPHNVRSVDLSLHLLPALLAEKRTGAGVDFLLGEILKTAFPEYDGKQSMLPDMFFDPTLSANELNTPLGKERNTTIGKFVAGNLRESLNREKHEMQMGKLLTELQSEPRNQPYWGALVLYTRNCVMRSHLTDRLKKVIEGLDLEDICRSDLRFGAGVSMFVSRQMCWHGSTESLDLVWSKIVPLKIFLEQKASASDDEDNRSFLAAAIFEAAFNIAAEQSTPSRRASKFTELLEPLVASSEYLRTTCTQFLQGSIPSLPAVEAAPLWPLLIRCRALA